MSGISSGKTQQTGLRDMALRHNNLTVDDIQERISRSKYHQLFRPKVLEVDNNPATLKLRVSMCDEFERQPDTGHWHGGVLASLVDISGCYALMLVAAGPMLTLNFSTDYLRLAVSEYLYATATVRRVGRTVGFVDVDITDDGDATVATGRACYAIRPDNT
jgi:uncharacterized protein (TIGR00369 family)